MRWINKIYKEYEQRTIEKFLLFPLTIGEETRWLEKVKIRQEYRYPLMVEYMYGKSCWWNNLAFVKNETEYVEGTEERILRNMPRLTKPLETT